MGTKKADHGGRDRLLYEKTAKNLVEEFHRVHRNGRLTAEKLRNLRFLLSLVVEAAIAH